MSSLHNIHEQFRAWYLSLPVYQHVGGPARGVIAAALVVLDRMKQTFSLEAREYLAEGGAQIRGASQSAVARILAEFDEQRPFLREGGRTNRGTPGAIHTMLDALQRTTLASLDEEQRRAVITSLQQYLVDRVREYHNRKRVEWVYDPSVSTAHSVRAILEAAKQSGKEGPVAQYLVGAKLQLRFPHLTVGNESYSTADIQLGRHGDFYIGDTAFHVTVAPMPPVFEKCKRNVESGYRVYLLVPIRILSAAQQFAVETLDGKITVEAMESFVGQNIDEIGEFSHRTVKENLRLLIETYNTRVNAIEPDKSMLIEMPPQLLNSLE